MSDIAISLYAVSSHVTPNPIDSQRGPFPHRLATSHDAKAACALYSHWKMGVLVSDAAAMLAACRQQ